MTRHHGRSLSLLLFFLLFSLFLGPACREQNRGHQPAEEKIVPPALTPVTFSGSDSPPSPPGENADNRPWVFLIVIDALRVDALGIAGAPGDPSPHLDRLAEEGVFFTCVYTSSPFTLTSIASLLTSLFPWQHQLLFREGAGLVLPGEIPVMAELFRQQGYHTAGFSGTYFRLSDSGLARGFDTFDENCAPAFFEQSADCLTQRFLGWLAQTSTEKPLFVYLHYVDPHRPYFPPEPFRSRFTQDLPVPKNKDSARGEVSQFTPQRRWWQFHRRPSADELTYLRALYQAETAYVDAKVGEMLEAVRARAGGGRRLVLVVTADHGEAFYEHGVMEHVGDLHEPVMRVPLLLNDGGEKRGKFSVPVRTIDLMPTLLELAEIAPPSHLSGRSLLPLLRGENLPLSPAAAVHFIKKEPEYALVLWPWKLFFRPTSGLISLYHLEDDPGELHDLAASHPEERATLLHLLHSLLQLPPAAQGSTPGPLPLETQRRLKALGYLP